MSTSSQSSASAAAYDISNAAAATAADGVLIHEHQQQQQQQYPASSLSQRFHPYLMPYGRDSGALLPSAQSSSAAAAATCADYNLNRGPPQPRLPDHHGAGMTDAGGGGGDTPFSGRRTQLHHQVQTGPSGGTTNSASSSSSSTSRRLREFIPDHKKDDEYWMKRRKNNEAAKRSREKRRINDMAMTKKILELTTDNKRLRLELEAIKRKYGLLPDAPFPVGGGGDGDDDVPLDRSVSPVYVGISSSDDSTPPSSSSFPFYQPVSPSPPVLDQFYHQESSLMVVDRRDNPDGTSLLPAVPAAAPRHYQSAEGSYRHPIAGQHAVLQQNVSMQNQPVASLKSVPFAEENVPVVRPLQSYSSTSTCTPARIGYLQLETPGGGDDDDDDDDDVVFSRGDGGKQPFDSMIRSSSLTDELLLSSSSPTISLAPPVASCGGGGGGGSLGQEYFQQPPRQRVTTSTSEIPLLTFSDLSSDDDDDVTVCLRKRSLLSPEAPLNLTKRSLSWQPPSSSARFPLPNSNCGASGRPSASSSSLLRNDTRSFRAAFQLQALPYHELWTEVSSKDSIENYSVQTLQQQQQRGAYLQDSRDSGEILSQYHQPPRPSMFVVKKTGANAAIKVEGADNLPSVAASTKNLKGYSDASCYEGRDEPSFLSDLATDSIDSVAQNSSRQVRGGVPLKVWHKMSLLSTAAGNSHAEKRDFQNTSMAASTTTVTSDAGFMYDDQSGDLLVDTSPNSSNTSGDSVDCASEFSDSDSTQARCRRDRAPDPPAGRRTRKSRKQLAAGLNLTAATILESENNKLKEELRSLSREVTDLKEIIGKKRKDSCNGNPGLGPYERIETDT